MPLTREDEQFLLLRAKRVRAWTVVGTALLAILLGIGTRLVWFAPLVANPAAVLFRLEGGTITTSTMMLSAAVLPVVVLLCLLLAFVLVIFAFVALARERCYLAMIETLGGLDPTGLTSPRRPRARRMWDCN